MDGDSSSGRRYYAPDIFGKADIWQYFLKITEGLSRQPMNQY